MDDGLLCIRKGILITDRRTCAVAGEVTRSTGCAIAKAVMPCVPYLIFTRIVILEVVDDKEIARREAPYVAGPRAVGIDAVDFIDPPVISRSQHELTGIIALVTKRFGSLVLR